MGFKFNRLNKTDVLLITPDIFKDSRGYFLEWYKQSEFMKNGITEQFVQGNHSLSKKGVLRGLHYQLPPFAQGKLVRCIQGEVFDVAVDIRKKSPSFGQVASAVLTYDNRQIMYIPPGFAHGFLTLSDTAELLYKTTSEYSPSHDRSILWNDPDISIDWPELHCDILISEKDRKAPQLKDAECFD